MSVVVMIVFRPFTELRMLTGRNFEQDHPADDELRKGRSKEQILEERRTI